MKKKKAIVTGITGQDGSYLAELLLEEGYLVYGMVRRSSTETFERIQHLMHRIELVQADLLDQVSLIHMLKRIRPDEVYNLAAQSFVPTSFDEPVLTGEFTALGVTRLLDAIRLVDTKIKFYQASSSEMFGHAPMTPQKMTTPFHLYQSLEINLGFPLQFPNRFRSVPSQNMNLRRAKKFWVNHNMFFPIEPDIAKSTCDKLPNSMRFSGSHNVIFGLIPLQHEPHGSDIISRKAPVSFCVKISHR